MRSLRKLLRKWKYTKGVIKLQKALVADFDVMYEKVKGFQILDQIRIQKKELKEVVVQSSEKMDVNHIHES